MGLAGLGHRQVVIAPKSSALAARAHEAGLVVEALPTGLLALRSLLRGFDIVHTHSGHAQTQVWMLSPLLHAVRVATRHVAFEPRNRFIHGLKYGRGCDGVIAVSQAVRGILLRAGVPERKIELIYTGMAIPAVVPTAEERNAARVAMEFGDGDFVIGHMGAFSAEKGQDIAVAAMGRLRRVDPFGANGFGRDGTACTTRYGTREAAWIRVRSHALLRRAGFVCDALARRSVGTRRARSDGVRSAGDREQCRRAHGDRVCRGRRTADSAG